MASSELIYSVRQLHEQAGISKSSFYGLLKSGKGPRVVRLGGRVLIVKETALAWLKSMEMDAFPAKQCKQAEPVTSTKETEITEAGSAAAALAPLASCPRSSAAPGSTFRGALAEGRLRRQPR